MQYSPLRVRYMAAARVRYPLHTNINSSNSYSVVCLNHTLEQNEIYQFLTPLPPDAPDDRVRLRIVYKPSFGGGAINQKNEVLPRSSPI
jgi:hypothetical protein